MAWGFPASPTCPPNGRGSTGFSAFLRSSFVLRTSSLFERVSVSWETEFWRQRQRCEMALRIQFSPSQRPSARLQARQFGAFR